jgi:hypothetical protein
VHAGILTFYIAVCCSFLIRAAWIALALIAILIYCIPFSWENTLSGFQSCFYFSTFCGFVGIWLTWRFPPFSKVWIIGWSFFVLTLFSMGSSFLAAMAALSMGVAFHFRNSEQKLRAWLSLVAFGLVVLGGFLLYVSVPGHESLKAHGVADFYRFFCHLTAWPTDVPFLGLILHFPVLAVWVYVLVRRLPWENAAWFLSTLGCWNLLVIAALAYGRANANLASRYTDGLAFGILVSLASAFWFCGILHGKWRLVAQALLVLQVACVAGGLGYNFSKKLCDEIAAKKALEPIQAGHLLNFFATDDLQFLSDKPLQHIPYPSASRLAQILRLGKLREVLSPALHPGLAPAAVSLNQDAFVKNSGVDQTTKPQYSHFYYGSYTELGNRSMGEIRLDFAASQSATAFQMLVAGYPLREGMRLVLETPDGKQHPISVGKDPKETWHKVVLPNPKSPFSILAIDGNSKFWLAFSLPTPIGRFSIFSQWLLANWWIFGVLGAVLFVLGNALLYKFDSKNTTHIA